MRFDIETTYPCPRLGQLRAFLREPWSQVDLGRSLPARSTDSVVLAEFIGTKAHRLGPAPSNESLAKMLGVIKLAMARYEPIPVLIPSAAVKVPCSVDAQVDLAEFSTIKTLIDLQHRVSWFYPPGLQFRIRAEDAVEYLISEGQEHLRRRVDGYVDTLRALITVMGARAFIQVLRETDLAPEITLMAAAKRVEPLFLEYLIDSAIVPDDQHDKLYAYRNLQAAGWNGPVSTELRSFFYARFAANYPHLDPGKHDRMIARYLSSIVARRKCGAVGDHGGWNERLEISFAQPLPGTSTTGTRVHFRTVPRWQSKNHLPPWIARGLIEINDISRIRLANWRSPLQQVGELTLTGAARVTLPIHEAVL
jgi:hypothetical protein